MEDDKDTPRREQAIQTTLEQIADMAEGMAHPSSGMEIIGIASPDNADSLQELRGNDDNIVPLKNKPAGP